MTKAEAAMLVFLPKEAREYQYGAMTSHENALLFSTSETIATLSCKLHL